ncbi:CCR4-NOT transcription complex subunit 1 [Linum perenne]
MPKLSVIVPNQIRFLLQSLNGANVDSVFRELCQFSDYGVEGCIMLLQICFEHLNIYRADLQNVHLEQVLESIFKFLMSKPNFSTVFCQSLGGVEISEQVLENLSISLHLTVQEKIGVGLALSDSDSLDSRMHAKKFCMSLIEELCINPVSITSTEQIQNIVMFLQRSDGFSKHVDQFMQMLSLTQSKDVIPFVLSPLLSEELREENFLRTIDWLYESKEDEFDSILADMEKEMSVGDIVKELGYGCTLDATHCKEILTLFQPLTEITISKILGTIVRSQTGLEDNQSTFSTFGTALGFGFPNDLPTVTSWDVEVLVKTINQLDPFPLHAICRAPWKNTEGQLSILRYAVLAPPEVFTFAHSGRQLAYMDAVNGHKLQAGCANHAWLCIDLVDVLCQLAERGHANYVRAMLDYPLKHCPEILLLGMSHVTTAYNLLQYEVLFKVFPVLMKSSSGADMIMYLWHINPDLVVRGFVDVQNIDPDIMTKIVDLCQELKILSSVLELIPFRVGIRLAALASRKEFLDLENWLTSNIVTFKDSFFEECLKFLKESQLGGSQDFSGQPFHHGNAAAGNFDINTSSTMLKALKAHSPLIVDIKLSEEMESLLATTLDSNPRLQNGAAADSPPPDGFSDDVEQGSVIKHQLVTHLTLGIALRGVLDALRKPPDSKMFVFGTKALEQFVDRLIEWPQYCNHILQISHLRGSHSELVAFIERALARISSGHLESEGSITSATQQHTLPQATPGNTEFNSSIATAVQQQSSMTNIQQRAELPPDDGHKLSVASSNDSKPPLSTGQSSVGSLADLSTLQRSASSTQAMQSSSPGFLRPSRSVTSTRFGSALNIETLVAAAERRESPIEAKAREFSDILTEQFYPWFAQYMVMKRASIEPNFHDLYLKFLDRINLKALNKEIVQATYENCKVLLGSELIKSSSEERSLLKNLGSWLGKLTIGRNQVLRAREIDPKSLIIEAYEKGLMIAVIPFTSKVLEPCQSSLAYQPPNPWTMGILGLLAEIYSMPNLKMNLKFDIEVLFKNLGVDMKDITPTSLLKDRKREIEGNPDFSNKDVGPSQPQVVPDVKSGMVSPMSHGELPVEVASPPNSGGRTPLLSQYAAPVHLSSGTMMEDEKLAVLSLSDQLPSGQALFQATPAQSPFAVSQFAAVSMANIAPHVVINQKLHGWSLHVHFQRMVPIAIERAVKEIVSGIVQRSVSIATQTTKELVLKDYAMENDETRICNAANLMVASLAGSLAHVTCKEPLRSSISSQLRGSLHGLNATSELLEHAVQLATNDNLDLGCALIEQAATEKAILTINGEIAQQLSLRRKHRDSVGQFETSMYAQCSMGGVPEALRPKPGHLSLSQQRVYEDFVRLPWQSQSTQGSQSIATGSSTSAIAAAGGGPAGAYGVVSGQVSSGYGAGGLGFEATQALDLGSEAIDSNSAPHLSSSSTNIGADAVVLQSSEKNASAVPFPMAAPATESQLVDSSDSVKECGSSSQPMSSSIASERVGSNVSEPLLSTRDALDKYQVIAQKMEALVASDGREAELQGVITEVPEIILRCISRDEAALAVAQKVFKGLYENASNTSHVTACLAILAAIRDVCKLVVKELTSWVIYSDEERKFNKDITMGLIRSELLNLAEYNVHMAKLIDGGRNKAATEFSVSLIQALVVEEYNIISELHNLVDALAKLASKPGSPESLQQLMEIVKNPTANVAALSAFSVGKDDRTRQKKVTNLSSNTREDFSTVESVEPDPAGFRDQVTGLFREWYRICELPGSNDAAYTHYLLQLHQNGFLKGDDLTDRFFRVLMELSVDHCLSSEGLNSAGMQVPQQGQSMSFLAIDIFAKLLFAILKVEQGSTKQFLLSKMLAVTVKYIQKDSEDKKLSFNPRPYFRLFINLLLDLVSLESGNEGGIFQILTSFAQAFHLLQPLKVPAFSYAWLELVSHRSFMPKLLTGNVQKGWPYVQRLLVDLFQFLEPFLRNSDLRGPVSFLYKGTLRVLLVLLHDFPEFLCDYHFTFCDVIPPSCIQMRNIILSAFPRNMRLPDPSTPNLKIDLLPEIREPPHILSEVDAALRAKNMKADVDEYLKTRQQGSSFLTDLKQRLILMPSEASMAGTRYNVSLINSLVLYTGMQAIQQLQARTPHAQATGSTGPLAFLVDAALDIYQTLVVELDNEGRYLVLNAVANQLRYPNNHTHYFSFVLLYLFAESNQEIIQEQITRVLLERLIVNRPHPWGLLITFIELIKNPRYNFWNRSFIRCAPEIEKLFESVARSCGGLKPMDESMVSGWVSEGAH